jgi:hypothetical protein
MARDDEDPEEGEEEPKRRPEKTQSTSDRDKERERNRQRERQRQVEAQKRKQGGGGQQPRKKGMLDGLGILATLVWGFNASLTAIVLTLALLDPIPEGCFTLLRETRTVVDGCGQPFTSWSIVLIVSFVSQALLSTARQRVRQRGWKRTLDMTEYAINIAGLYWLFCIKLGLLSPVKQAVDLVASVSSISMYAGIIMIVVIAVFLQEFEQALRSS